MKKTNLNTTIDASKLEPLNKFLFQDDFQNRLEAVKKIKVTLTETPKVQQININNDPNESGVLKVLEAGKPIKLDLKNGCEFAKSAIIEGYDESKLQFLTLEGIASFISHAMVCYANDDLLPVTYLSFYFYSRSEKVIEKSKYFRSTKDPGAEENRDYAIDRNFILEKYAVSDSLLIIDGPLIGGNISSYTTKLVENLEIRNVSPIFIVKNSDSNLVIDNVEEYKGKYHSDLHWAFVSLAEGERTPMFIYEDKYNKKNTKVFFYIKPFNNISPQRVELHISTYESHIDILPTLFNTIYYLYVLHGDLKNPQVRPVVVAEKYAREVLGIINPYSFMKVSGVTPTMNQTRFGG